MSEKTNEQLFAFCRETAQKCRAEAAKRIVGQTQLIDGILTALIAGGHVLLEGVPGLAKTLAVKTFSALSNLDFKRIQFTPDLLPADLTGTLIFEQASGKFTVRQGPVFTNMVLADEINRAPAKVQSALLEAMAERQVTIGDKTLPLPEPFFVLATQNPIEQEGTYNLPEAELDRFLLKLIVRYPSPQEEFLIVKNSTDGTDAADVPVSQVFSAEILKKMRDALNKVTCDDKIIEYIVSIVSVTRAAHGAEKKGPFAQSPQNGGSAGYALKGREDILKYVTFGASPRASLALHQCAKIAALFEGRSYVLPEDVKAAAHNVLRHRLSLSYEAAAEGLTADDIIAKILSLMPVP